MFGHSALRLHRVFGIVRRDLQSFRSFASVIDGILVSGRPGQPGNSPPSTCDCEMPARNAHPPPPDQRPAIPSQAASSAWRRMFRRLPHTAAVQQVLANAAEGGTKPARSLQLINGLGGRSMKMTAACIDLRRLGRRTMPPRTTGCSTPSFVCRRLQMPRSVSGWALQRRSFQTASELLCLPLTQHWSAPDGTAVLGALPRRRPRPG